MKCPHCGKTFEEDLLIQDAPTRKAQAEEIYKLYPRKLARPAALKAIMTALKKVSFVDLKAKVAALAVAWDNHDKEFLPYPATWFNQERFNDDPSTWAPRVRPQAGPPVHIQIKRLEECIEVHPANPTWVGHKRERVTEADKVDLKAKRDMLARLKQQSIQEIR
jgi:hypothetical protein